MNKALTGFFKEADSEDKTCLSVSHSVGFGRMAGLTKTKMTEANYPEHNILALDFPSNYFDFCISDQVFEHIEGNPFQAFSETARVIKPGGFVCHTTCFINQIHGVPKDFWRYTPDALSLLAKESGLDVVVANGWGNREVIGLMRSRFRMLPIPNNPSNPLYVLATRNEPDWPIVVWVVARKPLVATVQSTV